MLEERLDAPSNLVPNLPDRARGLSLGSSSGHPSGDPTPSPDDARLTLRLAQAADILDMPLLDHLIVGDAGRYFSFRESGTLTTRLADGARA